MIDNFIQAFQQSSLVQYYVSAVLMFWPMGRIFWRAGFSPFWALLLGVPMAGHVVCAAVLTFRRWPRLNKTKESVA